MVRILVADDDDVQRDNLVWAAKSVEGHQVVEAESADGAIRQIKRNDFDLIVTDLVMKSNKTAGLQVLLAAREKDVKTQVILCTGASTPEVSDHAMHLGAFDYLPINSDSLNFWNMLRRKISLAVQFRKAIAGNFAGNKTIFIVHGHDDASKRELRDFLSGLGLNPVILHQQDSLGMVMIEKFEHYASRAAFALILMTADDPAPVSSPEEGKWRARQNVIMELGWFMSKLGRNRVAILYKGEPEIPTDILGVVYHKFERSISEVGEDIRQRLRGAGIIDP